MHKQSHDYTLFNLYFELVQHTEPPLIYGRWCLLSAIGALLGRNFYLPFGQFEINPNMYVMLIGSPGARKSTAIKSVKNLLVDIGYDTMAADRSTKEKFLVDLEAGMTTETGEEQKNGKDIASKFLFGELDESESREAFIVADEFNDFIGNGNLDFISFLGNMWDYKGVYRNRIKNGKSVAIPNPTISILSGNTATGFAAAFPPEMIGQGFLSRLLLIYGEPTDRKITFPKRPEARILEQVNSLLKQIKLEVQGAATLDSRAESLLDKIYQNAEDLPDPRFRTYSTRRFTHLLKLCLIVTASRCSTIVVYDDVMLANSILKYTETLMPRALGEFGKSKYADTATKIIELLSHENKPMSTQQIWKAVAGDFDKMTDFGMLLGRLKEADKIIAVGTGIMLNRGALKNSNAGDGEQYFDYKLLKEAEDKL